MHKLIEYSDDYSKTSGILQQYCRDGLALNDDAEIQDFTAANAITDSFKIKEKITGQTGNNGRKGVEIMVPLSYLSHFWRTFEMPLINCAVNLDLNWSKNCVIVTNNADQGTKFSLTYTKRYVPVVTLSTKHNAKLI